MRLIALLILPSLAFAAPAPEQPEKPGVELKLSADNQYELEITIQNNGKEPLELPYGVTPFEHFAVELLGEHRYDATELSDARETSAQSVLNSHFTPRSP